MRILVLQLSRMGDLAQTLPVVHALAEAHPGAEILLACRKGFHSLLRDAELPATVLPLPDSLLNPLGQIQTERLPAAAESLRKEPLLLQSFDSVINVTHDYESAVLASMVDATLRLGRVHAPPGEVRTVGAPSRYLWAMVRHRTENLFNLSDLQMLMAGLAPRPCAIPLPIKAEAMARASERLRAAGWDGERTLIGLQLGASDFHRAWGAGAFARMAGLVAKGIPADFVLFGDERERVRVDRFRAVYPGRVLDLAGQTALAELPALLRSCALVIGNDTGTVHVAAATGVRTLGIFFATAFFTETAPYGRGHAVLQTELPCSPCNASVRCPEQKCRAELSPEVVSASVLWQLGVSDRPSELPPLLQLYRSEFDDNGTLLYEPVDTGRASPAYRMALGSRLAWSGPLGVGSGTRARYLFAACGGIAPKGAFGGAASWAEEGRNAAREMASGLSEAGWKGSPMRLATLRERLKEIPVCLADTAGGLLGDYCRMAFMDLDGAGSPRVLEQVAERFEEIREVAAALSGAPNDG